MTIQLQGLRDGFRVICSARMLVTLIMGFASGLPLLLTMSVLQAWMKEKNVDLSVIGLITLVQIPYTWKFLWSPLLDRFIPPFLGRRRGWLFLIQIALVCAIAGLGFTDPVDHFRMMIFAALLIAFLSASQDIVIDAYRREDLPDRELGLGSSLYIYGYRMGTLLASGGGLIMADHLPFRYVYLVMASCMLPCIFATLFAPEPALPVHAPTTLRDAVIAPLKEYLGRPGALLILAFILLYKIGDTMAGAMTIPFYLDLGFSKTEIGTVVKLFGTWAVIIGAVTGGFFMLRFGIRRSLWVFGFLQAISTGCFALLVKTGPDIITLSFVIAFENLSSGMGTAAFVAFMASITDKRFTATQYALLSSLMAFPRVLASAPTGFIAQSVGWGLFFIICMLAAAPGIFLLSIVAPWSLKNES